jgi:Fic family protein/DNA-binding Xre family transcriptional regulator
LTIFVKLFFVMFALLKSSRIKKSLRAKDISQALGIDQSLISKFENGTRLPTKDQVIKLASLLEIPEETLIVAWLKQRILNDVIEFPFAKEALEQVQEELAEYALRSEPIRPEMSAMLTKIDQLRNTLVHLRKNENNRIVQALETEYTFESNRIEGNTLSLQETELVINQGLTISGKTMQEHLEAINHADAIAFIKQLAKKRTRITERDLLQIHNLILRGISQTQAGRYRTVQVMISGSNHNPPNPFQIREAMDDFFDWYNKEFSRMHPVLFAAEAHLRLVSIHPFIDGNGRTSRLLMNLHLLQNGYCIANLKGDNTSRLNYYKALEEARSNGNTDAFRNLIAQHAHGALERMTALLSDN